MWGVTATFLAKTVDILISIHTPRVGRDLSPASETNPDGWISIHTPRVGRDEKSLVWLVSGGRISIHTPRVGRDPYLLGIRFCFFLFQSTRPVWGVT